MVRHRITAVAQRTGVTAQQIRNYADQGLLPDTDWTDGGHRVLGDQHVDAVETVRVMAVGHGWVRTRAVMTAVHRGAVDTALREIDASHADLARERTELASALATFRLVADQLDPVGSSPVRIGRVAAAAGVTTPVLRSWERRGLLRPQRRPGSRDRAYAASEQRLAVLVALLRRGHYPFDVIEAAISTVRTAGDTTLALAQLDRRRVEVDRLSRARTRATGRLAAYLDRWHL